MKLEIYGNSKKGFSAHGEDNGEYDLEPCPFCDSSDVEITNTHSPSYWAECNNCGAQGPSGRTSSVRIARKTKSAVRRQHEEAFSKAHELWNTRRED